MCFVDSSFHMPIATLGDCAFSVSGDLALAVELAALQHRSALHSVLQVGWLAVAGWLRICALCVCSTCTGTPLFPEYSSCLSLALSTLLFSCVVFAPFCLKQRG